MHIAQPLIYTHAITGGLALISGGMAIASKKGKSIHRASGKVFFYSMLISALTALVVALLPGHQSTFLFCVGVFSIYFLIAGYRALGFNKPIKSLFYDKLLSTLLLITSLIMLLYPILLEGSANIVLTVFGIVGLFFGTRDMFNYRNPEGLQQNWLCIHLGKMTAAYISAVSAFFVVNQFLPPLYNWFLPSAFGSIFITYWLLKVKKRTKKNKAI